MTLILEIAAGIVLAIVILYAAVFFFAWVASWSTGTKLIAVIIVTFLLVTVYNELFPDRKTSSDVNIPQRETRAHFAARYKKSYPETASTPDEELVKQVLHDYPEWCSKVEGGCP